MCSLFVVVFAMLVLADIYSVVKVTVDSRGGGPKFKNTTLQKWIKHMHHESVIK